MTRGPYNPMFPPPVPWWARLLGLLRDAPDRWAMHRLWRRNRRNSRKARR